MGEPTLDDNPMQDNLVKLVLTLVSVAILMTIVFVCLPDKAGIAKAIKQELAMFKMPQLKREQVAKAALEPARNFVSYSDPRVRRTLNIPWAN